MPAVSSYRNERQTWVPLSHSLFPCVIPSEARNLEGLAKLQKIPRFARNDKLGSQRNESEGKVVLWSDERVVLWSDEKEGFDEEES